MIYEPAHVRHTGDHQDTSSFYFTVLLLVFN